MNAGTLMAGTLRERLAVTLRASGVRSCAAALAALVLGATTAGAVTIELKDVAPDRVERQRAEAEGRVPLPGTPDLARLEERRTALGLSPGTPVLIRIFKSEMQLELWARKDDRYVLFATYPICHFSGTLGPKLKEGDRQTPEGFYTVTMRQMHHVGRWPRSIDLGFPNAFDKALSRNGSYILVHGGCSSVGCVAMTNGVNAEIYSLTMAALRAGQRYVPVHVFPFRLTDENLARHRGSEWHGFWTNLKDGYGSFETTRLPPKVSVCNGRYIVEDGRADEPVAADTPPAHRGARRALYRDRGIGAILNSCPAPQLDLAAKDANTATPIATPGPQPELAAKDAGTVSPIAAPAPQSELAAKDAGATSSIASSAPQPEPAAKDASTATTIAAPVPQPEPAVKDAGTGDTAVLSGAALGEPPSEPVDDPHAAAGLARPATQVRDIEAGGAQTGDATSAAAPADRVVEQSDSSTKR